MGWATAAEKTLLAIARAETKMEDFMIAGG
jgi:hypothetical protein